MITVVPGSRIVEGPAEYLVFVGRNFEDPKDVGRVWTVQHMYAPIPGTRLSGTPCVYLRARVLDQYGFSSFINERDLELLLEVAKPGAYCPMTGGAYPGIRDEQDGWHGFNMGLEEIEDDLQFLEMTVVRPQNSGLVPYGAELIQRIHREEDIDIEKRWSAGCDWDPYTRQGPDGRIETIGYRWQHIESTRWNWKEQQWKMRTTAWR